jgi:hypothetical protein
MKRDKLTLWLPTAATLILALGLWMGYTITTNGIEALPTFWDNGCRYFKILSPTGEQVEFSQKC